jgi:hypothetical protein
MKPRRGAGQSADAAPGAAEKAGRETLVIEEIAAEFSTEELLEFLEADQRPVEADPAFRERLREELWELVRRQAQSKG